MSTLTACTAPSQTDLNALAGNPTIPTSSSSSGSGGSTSATITQFEILSGDFQTATISSPAPLPLKVVLRTSAGLPDPGKTVFFTVVGGASYGTSSSSSAVTDSDGVAQITYTAGTHTGSIAVTASTSSQISLTFTMNVTGVSVYTIAKASTSNGNSQTGNVGATLTNPFKVVVTDSTTNSVVPNVTVRFLANQGSVAGSFGGATYVDILTDSNGIATSSNMTLNTTSGVHTIRASLLGDAGVFTDFTATAIVPSASTIDSAQSTLTLSAATVVADGVSNVTATIRVKDQYGNLIPNNAQTISFTSTPTTSSNNIGSLAIWDSSSWTYASAGTYTRTFSVNTATGTISFDTVTVSGVSLTSTLPTCNVVASSSVIPANSDITTSTNSLTANGVSTATIIVTLKDYFSNQVSNSGHTVIISTDRGSLQSTTLSYHTASGTYRTFFTTPTSVGPGSATFTLVSVDGTSVAGKTASITLNPGTMTSIGFSTQPAPTSNNTDTAFTTQPIVKGYDANSNVVTTDSTSTVTLTAYDTAACAGSVVASGLSGTTTKTLSSGTGTFTDIAAIKTSVKSIKATLGSLTACSSTLTISPGAINSISFSTPLAPTTTDTDSAFTTQPVVTAYDANSNIVTTDSTSNVVLTAYNSAACAGATVASGLSGTTTVTLSSGVSTFTNIAAVKVAVKSIKATLGAKTACSSALTVNTGAPLVSISSGDGPSAAHGTTVPAFVAIVKDANANTIQGVTVDWTVTAGGGSLSSASNASDANGLSSSTLTLGSATGTNTVRAAIHSNPTVYTTFTATSGTTSYSASWPFTSGTSSSYMPSSSDWLTSTLEMTSGGVCRLIVTDQTDNSSTEFNSGTYSGVIYGTLADGVSTGLRLANNGGCSGQTTSCASQAAPEIYELNTSWTPQWSSVVSYYKMNNNWNDSKGSFNGVASGATFTTAAKVGSHAGSFDGTTNNVNFGGYGVTPSGYTIMFWAKRSTISNAFAALFDMSANGLVSSWIYENGNIGFGNVNTGWSTWNSVWTDKANYHHIAIVVPTTVAGTNPATLYFDGVTKGAITVTTNGAWDDVRLGSFSHTTALSFPGQIDDFATWSVGLGPTEVKQIYDRQSVKYSGLYTSRVMDGLSTGQSWTTFSWVPTLPFFKELPDYASSAIQNESSTDYTSLNSSTLMNNIVGLWHFSETSGTTLADDSGNALVTTASSGVTVGAAGKLGTGIYLDGTGNGKVTTTYKSVLDITGSLTISTWINITSATAYQSFVMNLGTSSPYPGYQLFTDATGTKARFDTYATGVHGTITGATTINDGVWHHLVAIYNGTTMRLYVDGVQDATANYSSPIGASGLAMYFGHDSGGAGRNPKGFMDEVAIWSRALGDGTSGTVNEVQQLYQRGAARLKFQVKTCTTNNCADNTTWKGPDGTSASYFSELNNNSAALAMNADVKKTLPSLTLSNFTSPPSTNRYFQYRAIFESDTTTTALMPELKTVTVDPVHYDKTSPWVYGINGTTYYSVGTLTETLGSSCAGGIGYNLGKGTTAAGATWYWWDSSKASDCTTMGSGAWCAGDGTATKSNDATTINSHVATFGTTFGTGTVYIKAFLKSSGSTPCELDNVQLNVEQ